HPHVLLYQKGSAPSWRFSYQSFQVPATLGIVLSLKVQCPFPLPYPSHYDLVYFSFWPPMLRDRNRHFCDLWYFLSNSHKRCIRPFFHRNRLHPALPRFFPFHEATTAFQDVLPTLLGLCPIQGHDDGAYFFQSGLSEN